MTARSRKASKEIRLPSPFRDFLLEARIVSQYIWDKGWAERNGGNLSVDVTECFKKAQPPAGIRRIQLEQAYPELANRALFITRTQCRIRNIALDPERHTAVLKMDSKGRNCRLIWGGKGEDPFLPTSEFSPHLQIHAYLRRTSSPHRAVLHSHPTELIALTHLPDYKNEARLNRTLWSIMPEVRVFVGRGVGFIPYLFPGSDELAHATVEKLVHHDVVLWEKHGATAIGKTLTDAFDTIDTLNKSAEIFFLCLQAGRPPEGLTDQQLDTLGELIPRRELA